MRVFVTGGTGFIGRVLVSRLAAAGHQVTVLTRNLPSHSPVRPGVRLLQGDPTQPGPWQSQFASHHAVVNLAGESLSGRWTAARKQRMLDSRVKSTTLLVQAMLESPQPPSVFLQASAIGFYGPSAGDWLDESAPAGHDFLARLADAWEQAALPAERAAIRTVRLRIGMVLDKDGGALPAMLPAFRYGFGAPLGHGRQFYSWIHREDLIRLMLFCLDSSLEGAVNASSPHPLPMREFGRILARVMLRPYWPVGVPSWLVRLLLGEMSTLVLNGQRVRPARALQAGFSFRYPELEPALHAIMGW